MASGWSLVVGCWLSVVGWEQKAPDAKCVRGFLRCGVRAGRLGPGQVRETDSGVEAGAG